MLSNRLPARAGSAVVLLAGFLVGCGGEQPVAPATPAITRRMPQVVSLPSRPDRYLVSFKSGEPANFAATVASLGGTVERRNGNIRLATVSGIGAAGAASLARLAGIESMAQDLIVQFLPVQNNVQRLTNTAAGGPTTNGTDQSGAFFYPVYQWNIRQVSANVAWGTTSGGAGKLVCILDTGIDPDHSDFAGRVDPNLMTSFISSPSFPGDLDSLDYNFHGTATAGYITTNGLGVASVAPDARLCSAKTLTVNGSGSFGDLVAAINWAANNHADVINMSSGGYIDRAIPGGEQLIDYVQRAVNEATKKGSVLVASSGNNGLNLDEDSKRFLFIPAQLANVVSVGATAPFNQTNFDGLAPYSNFGGRTGVDLMAPGGDFSAGNVLDFDLTVCSQYQLTLPFTCGAFDYVFVSGTSESSPHVAAAAAVVAAQLGNPTPSQTVSCLLNGTDNIGPRQTFGFGRLNVAKAATCP